MVSSRSHPNRRQTKPSQGSVTPSRGPKLLHQVLVWIKFHVAVIGCGVQVITELHKVTINLTIQRTFTFPFSSRMSARENSNSVGSFMSSFVALPGCDSWFFSLEVDIHLPVLRETNVSRYLFRRINRKISNAVSFLRKTDSQFIIKILFCFLIEFSREDNIAVLTFSIGSNPISYH